MGHNQFQTIVKVFGSDFESNTFTMRIAIDSESFFKLILCYDKTNKIQKNKSSFPKLMSLTLFKTIKASYKIQTL